MKNGIYFIHFELFTTSDVYLKCGKIYRVHNWIDWLIFFQKGFKSFFSFNINGWCELCNQENIFLRGRSWNFAAKFNGLKCILDSLTGNYLSFFKYMGNFNFWNTWIHSIQTNENNFFSIILSQVINLWHSPYPFS